MGGGKMVTVKWTCGQAWSRRSVGQAWRRRDGKELDCTYGLTSKTCIIERMRVAHGVLGSWILEGQVGCVGEALRKFASRTDLVIKLVATLNLNHRNLRPPFGACG